MDRCKDAAEVEVAGDGESMQPVNEYIYADEVGEPTHRVLRFVPKNFRIQHLTPDGEWKWGKGDKEPLPYRLQELLRADKAKPVLLCEGERDVDRAIHEGLVATTNAMGAMKWTDRHSEYLSDRDVLVIPDNDPAGENDARRKLESLHRVGAKVRILRLPGLPDKGDFTDWMNNGGTVARLLQLIDETPTFEPCETDAPQPEIVCLSDVEARPVDWFWFNRIPCGMLTLLLGDPGLGKSFLSLYMAAKVSTGSDWPNDGVPGSCAPKGSTVILSAEDDLARTIRPRLDSLGADASKVFAIEGVRLKDDKDREYHGYFNLQRDLLALRQTVRSRRDTRLVIVDPLSAYLGKLDSHRDTNVRSVLAPLVQLAQETGVAIVAVMHLNKSAGGKALYRGLGSIAFTAAARTVWLVSTDPNALESRRRLLTPAKHNLLIDPTGLSFEIIDGQVVFDGEPVTLSSDEALGYGGTVAAPEKDRAVAWLKELLSPGRSVATSEVTAQAKEQGITKSTLRRAKKELKVVSYPVTQPDGKRVWLLKLPEGAQQR